MKKIILASLFSLLTVLSIQANASATLQWGSVPTSNSNVQISSGASSATTILGRGVFNESLSNGFIHQWNFTLDSTTTVAAGIINLFADQFIGAQVRLDGNLLSGGATGGYLGGVTLWSFSEILTGGSHNLTVSADSVDVLGGQALYSMLLTTPNLTASPIPAAVWLFGSAILGIGGLASRRKTLSAEV